MGIIHGESDYLSDWLKDPFQMIFANESFVDADDRRLVTLWVRTFVRERCYAAGEHFSCLVHLQNGIIGCSSILGHVVSPCR
jgi:hypothetical protein